MKELIRDPYVLPWAGLLGFFLLLSGSSGVSLLTGSLVFLILGVVLGVPIVVGLVYFSATWTWTCPNCQKYPLGRAADHCPECGHKMRFIRKSEMRRLCVNGHRTAEKWDHFCPKCGAALVESKEESLLDHLVR